MGLAPTADPYVFIETQRDGYVRYVNIDSNRRWEMYGKCDRRGNCIIGALIGGRVITPGEAPLVAHSYSGLDVPITPEFSGCCPFEGRWLE